MSKRAPQFERNEHDFYPTPYSAVLPLLPFLAGIYTFAEPCCGEGHLVNILELHRLRCVFRDDINSTEGTNHDAAAMTADQFGKHHVDVIITNPPWERETLHRIIDCLKWIKPTWLLLDADWLFTKQAAVYLPDATHIVAIGRIKWIEDSPSVGKDNCCWVRFVGGHDVGPTFYPNW